MEMGLIAERFWYYVTAGKPDECWIWRGGRTHFGYGVLGIPGTSKQIRAHRLSYQMATGIDPGRLHVCHKCDNPPCVNPAHLWLGTAKDNIRDSIAKGRWGKRGGQNGTHMRKLTEDQARGIYAAYWRQDESLITIGERYSITRQNVWLIGHKRTWKHLH